MTCLKNQVHDILQRSNIKLTTYVSDIFFGSGRRILALLENGEVINLASIEQAGTGKRGYRLNATPKQILASLDGALSYNDRFLMAMNMNLLASYQRELINLESRIYDQLETFSELYHRLQAILGVGEGTAQIIIAEIGSDVSPFPDAHHLASWAGLCPGSYESAGKKHGAHTLHGNKYLKTAMITAAMAAKSTKQTGLRDFYWRL